MSNLSEKKIVTKYGNTTITLVSEEMAAYIDPTTGQWTSGFNNGVNTCFKIQDNLIAESEGK